MKKHIYATILSVALFAWPLVGQTWQLAKGITGPGNAVPQTIATDALGNIFVGGTFSDSVSFGVSHAEVTTELNGASFVTSYSSIGSVLWSEKFDGVGGSTVTAITVVGADVYVTGAFSGTTTFGSTTFTATGSFDGFLVKMDALTGAVTWARQFGGINEQIPFAIAASSSGLCISGSFDLSIAFGSTTLTSAGGYDAFILMYDLAGSPQSVAAGGGVNDDFAYGIACDASGTCFIAGNFNEGSPSGTATFGTTTLTSFGNADVFLVKYVPGTGFAWTVQAGGPSNDNAAGVCMTSNGAICVAGSFVDDASFVSDTLAGGSWNNGFVAFYDQNGTNTSATLLAYDAGYCVDVAPGLVGDVYVTGNFSGTALFGSVTLDASMAGGMFVACVAANGDCVAAIAAGTSNTTVEERAITTDANGSVYVAGDFNGQNTLTFGSCFVANSDPNSSDGFFTKLTGLTGISDAVSAPPMLSVYPNPFVEKLTIELPIDEVCSVQVIDLAGRVVTEARASGIIMLARDAFGDAGAYILRVTDAEGTVLHSGTVIAQ